MADAATGGRLDGGPRPHDVDRSLTPALVLLDPPLTAATPDALWAGSGLKAIDHAVEMILAPGRRPVADIVALAGIGGLATHLGASLSASDEGTARLECQIAAWQCYAAAGNARLGLSHRIGHVLGGTFGVPHRATSSITLPAVLRVAAAREPHRTAMVAAALAPGTSADAEPADAGMAAGRRDRIARGQRLPGGAGRARQRPIDLADRVAAGHLVTPTPGATGASGALDR